MMFRKEAKEKKEENEKMRKDLFLLFRIREYKCL